MRVLINAASYAQNMSGLQRHAFNLARCLFLRPEIQELHFVVAPWQVALVPAGGIPDDPRVSIHVAEMKPSSLSRNIWHYRELPHLASRLKVNLVHLSFPVPVNAAAVSCPVVVTLHDLYPYELPSNFGFPKYIVNRAILKQCLRSVDSIACVSDATLLRLKQYVAGSVWKKAVRIYNCVEMQRVSPTLSPIPNWKGEPFLLCVAQHRANKNLPLLIRAFEMLLRSGRIDRHTKLVIVGIKGPRTTQVQQSVSDSGVSQNIQLLEGLPEAELQWCYRHCEALVVPSTTEGFGLPVAEGLLMGCRIVCSDIPAHREVADGQCRFVKLGANEQQMLAKAILATLKEQKRAPISLPQFSAAALGAQYIELYRRVACARIPAGNAAPSAAINLQASKGRIL